jgi:hypothetical protein
VGRIWRCRALRPGWDGAFSTARGRGRAGSRTASTGGAVFGVADSKTRMYDRACSGAASLGVPPACECGLLRIRAVRSVCAGALQPGRERRWNRGLLLRGLLVFLSGVVVAAAVLAPGPVAAGSQVVSSPAVEECRDLADSRLSPAPASATDVPRSATLTRNVICCSARVRMGYVRTESESTAKDRVRRAMGRGFQAPVPHECRLALPRFHGLPDDSSPAPESQVRAFHSPRAPPRTRDESPWPGRRRSPGRANERRPEAPWSR